MKISRRVRIAAVASLAASGGGAFADVVAHWKFDEKSGTIAADSVGANNGALLGGSAFGPGMGIDGGAVHLARATNSTVDLGNVFAFTGGVDFSISFWLRLDTAGDTTSNIPIARHTSGVFAGYLFNVNLTACYGAVQKAMFYTGDTCGTEAVSTASVNDGQWRHVVGVYDAGAAKGIYVDGGPLEDSAPATTVNATAAHLLVGGVYVGGSPTGAFDGHVDDVQIYDQTLTCK